MTDPIEAYINTILFDENPTRKPVKCILTPSQVISYDNEPLYETYRIDEKCFSKEMMEKLALSFFSGINIIATNRSLTGSTPLVGAVTAAELLTRMGLMEKKTTICLDSRFIDSPPQPPDGIRIVYDDLGCLAGEPDIPAWRLSPGKRGRLIWNGNIPPAVDELLKAFRDEELRINQISRIIDNAKQMFRLEVAQDTFLNLHVYSGIAKSLVELSYDTLNYDDLPPNKPLAPVNGNGKWLSDNVIFTELRTPSFEDYGFACDITRIFNLIAVWVGFEKKYGFVISFSTNKGDYSGICELGRLIGADSAIKAVASGVLPEDVLA